jgi:DNA-binding transcriptional LysR family regulator
VRKAIVNRRLESPHNVDRTDEMTVFVSVVERGGFSQAGRALGLSPSGVSKLMSRLEHRLGTALLRRSTRHVGLTPEGEKFYDRVRRILADIELAEREAIGTKVPSGRIRINSSASYVAHVLAHILRKFLGDHSNISIDITLSDIVTDLFKEGCDIAIRAGELSASNLTARSLGDTRLIVVASPTWIDRHGMPGSIDELLAQDRLGFVHLRAGGEWLQAGEPVLERVRVSDGEGIRRLALAGVAPARLAEFTIRSELASGQLVPLLPDSLPVRREPFHAVYVGKSAQLPARLRLFLDYLTVEGRVG